MTVNLKNGKLTVQLYENALSGKKDEYFGKILIRGSVSQTELADMARISDTSLSREQLIHANNLMSEAALNCLADGFSVQLGPCTARPVINGSFTGEAARFNSEQNYVAINFSATPRAREVIKTAIVEVVGTARTGCVINRVIDVRTGEENATLTPGKNLKIFGTRLAIEGTEDEIGVWFINADDETNRIRVEPDDIVDNNPSQLTIVVPPLKKGEWFIQVTTKSTGKKNIQLKEARSYRLDIPLTVM